MKTSATAEQLGPDPESVLIGSPKFWDHGAALTSTLCWFETELLTRDENLVGLLAVNSEMPAETEMPTRAKAYRARHGSSESPVHGAQERARITGTSNRLLPPMLLVQ
jgi:hypothetical protein